VSVTKHWKRRVISFLKYFIKVRDDYFKSNPPNYGGVPMFLIICANLLNSVRKLFNSLFFILKRQQNHQLYQG